MRNIGAARAVIVWDEGPPRSFGMSGHISFILHGRKLSGIRADADRRRSAGSS